MAGDGSIATAITAIIGAATGSAGLGISVMNYLRDRPSVDVFLSWDMQAYDTARQLPRSPTGVIRISNRGRRPVFVSHVHLVARKPTVFDRVLRRAPKAILLLHDSVSGQRLGEGDAPWFLSNSQNGLEKHKASWNTMRAAVVDTAGRVYYSNVVEKRPSWAEIEATTKK
jgi:hypothetical protein